MEIFLEEREGAAETRGQIWQKAYSQHLECYWCAAHVGEMLAIGRQRNYATAGIKRRSRFDWLDEVASSLVEAESVGVAYIEPPA